MVISTSVFVLLLAIFLSLSDLGKARATVSIIGIHQNNVAKFAGVIDVLRSQQLKKALGFEELKERHKKLLTEYINTYNREVSFDDIFTLEEVEWDAGCTPIGNGPRNLLLYMFYSDDFMIISYRKGGLATSPWIDFYEILPTGLNLVGSVNSVEHSLLILAIALRFDDSLINWATKEEPELLIE